MELETDKVSVEVRAEQDGVITAIRAKEGDTVEIGAALAEFEAGSSGGKPAEPKKAESKADAPKKDDACRRRFHG